MTYCQNCHVEIDAEYSPYGVSCDACRAKFDAECEAERLAEYERNKERKERRRAVYLEGNLPLHFGLLFRCQLADRDGSICGICGDPLDALSAHVDHIIPISRGGKHVWDNVQLTHPVCNMRKGNRG